MTVVCRRSRTRKMVFKLKKNLLSGSKSNLSQQERQLPQLNLSKKNNRICKLKHSPWLSQQWMTSLQLLLLLQRLSRKKRKEEVVTSPKLRSRSQPWKTSKKNKLNKIIKLRIEFKFESFLVVIGVVGIDIEQS